MKSLLYLFSGYLFVSLIAQAQPPRGEGREDRPPPLLSEGRGERPGLGKRPDARRKGGPFAVERWFQRLQQEDPEVYQQLMKLRRDDPEAFRVKLRERLLQAGRRAGNQGPRIGADGPRPGSPFLDRQKMEEMRAFRSKLQEAVRKLQVDPDDDNRSAVRKLLTEEFDKKLQFQETHLARIRQEIETLEAAVARKKQQRKALIQARLEEIEKNGLRGYPPGPDGRRTESRE